MKISFRSSHGWRLRDPPFPFQQTYKTPLTDLPRFVRILLSRFQFREASVCIETIVFKPNELIQYLKDLGIVTDEEALNRSAIQAQDESEGATLLENVLAEWIDFAFIPSPTEFTIYADHDQYTTVFTASSDKLGALRSDMKQQGFTEVEEWMWTGPHSQGIIEGTNTNV